MLSFSSLKLAFYLSTLSSPCSRSDFPLSLDKVWLLLALAFSHLAIWADGSVPFPFAKGDSDIIANYSLCGTEATLSYSASPVCSSFSAEACAILQALRWSRQHQQVCHFSSPTLALSLPLCFFLHLSFYLKLSGRNHLLSLLLGYNGSLDTHFSPGTTHLMSWRDGERCFCLLQSPVVPCLSQPLFSFLRMEAYRLI